MDIIGALSNLLTGGVAGGLTGIIGSISSAFVTYKMKKLEYQHEKELKKLDMEAKKIEIEVAKQKIEGMLDIEEQKTLQESYKTSNKPTFDKSYFTNLPDWAKVIVGFLFAILDFIRGIIRPLATVYLLLLTTWIGYKTYQANPESFVASATLVVELILYLTATAVSWWFSDRKFTKFFEERKR